MVTCWVGQTGRLTISYEKFRHYLSSLCSRFFGDDVTFLTQFCQNMSRNSSIELVKTIVKSSTTVRQLILLINYWAVSVSRCVKMSANWANSPTKPTFSPASIFIASNLLQAKSILSFSILIYRARNRTPRSHFVQHTDVNDLRELRCTVKHR